MPLYNSSEVFVPAKQYGNTIHSPWILKRLNVTHSVPLFTSDDICKRTLSLQAIHLNAQQLTLILIKALWFIHVNAVFAPHIYCVCSYSKHL